LYLYDSISLITEFYSNDGKIDLEQFKAKYENREVYWETAAAIGAATGSAKLVSYAGKHKGGDLNMCTALKNLELEGEKRAEKRTEKRDIKVMVSVLRELDVDDETIIEKIQAKYKYNRKDAQELLV
jgi:hypothetical protein